MTPVLALALSTGALAAVQSPEPVPQFSTAVSSESTNAPPPGILRLANQLIVPIERGLFVRLPLIDTDPNRGLTVGVLPVWVVEDTTTDRIERIYAPSVDYNKIFGVNTTFRLYDYPTTRSELVVRGAYAEHVNSEAFVEYTDQDLFGQDASGQVRAYWNRDGSKRFFGFGPGTTTSNESNYTVSTGLYRLEIGVPLDKERRFRWYLNQQLHFDKTEDGPITSLAALSSRYPGLENGNYQMTDGFGTALGYDTRDSLVTTTQGTLAKAFVTGFPAGAGNPGNFQDFGLDAREFRRLGPTSRRVLAGQLHFEQMEGSGIPFYDLPTLGGSYSFRAYGDGRFTDRGSTYANLEARWNVWNTQFNGLPVEAWLDPFVGLGTVFPEVSAVSFDSLKWVAGGALRFVARPQVVGSIDFGVGQEGVAVFMDIGYSY